MVWRLIVLVTYAALVSTSALPQSLSLEGLQARCAQKTLVYSRAGVRVGDHSRSVTCFARLDSAAPPQMVISLP